MGTGPDGIVAGDFTGDRPPRPGIVNRKLQRHTGRSRCCWATATARSSPRSATRPGGIPTAIVAGDFNGDGHLDLAVAISQPPMLRESVSFGAAGQR